MPSAKIAEFATVSIFPVSLSTAFFPAAETFEMFM